MTPVPWWHTALIISGWLFAAAGVALLLWALFGDRSRGRKRCPKCWYDMSGAASLTCPECGYAAKSERQLVRTRRRWSRAIAAILLVTVGLQGARYGGPGRTGVLAAAPTFALILLVDDYERQDATTGALVDRLRSGWVSPWERRWAARRELNAQVIDWSACAQVRPKWPANLPVRVWLKRPRNGWSMFDWRRAVLHSPLSPDEEAVGPMDPPHIHVFRSGASKEWIELPPPKLGLNRYPIDVCVHGGLNVSACGTIELTVEGVESIELAIDPEPDPAINDDLLSQVMWRARVEDDKVPLWIGPDFDWQPAGRDVAYAYQVELYKDGLMIARDVVEWEGLFRTAYFVLPIAADWNATLEPRRWTVRISPAPEAALIQTLLPKYWAGQAEFSLADLPFGIETGSGATFLDVSTIDVLPLNKGAHAKLAATLPLARPRVPPASPPPEPASTTPSRSP